MSFRLTPRSLADAAPMRGRTGPTLDAATDARIRAEQVAYLFRFPARLFGNVFNGALVVGVLWGDLSSAILLPWLGLVCAVTLGRYWLALAYRRAAPGPGASERWTAWSMLGSCLSAALLGAASFVIWLSPDIAYPVFIAFAIAGTSAAATAMSYPHLPSVYGYLGLSVGPAAINLLAGAEGITVAMGAMGLLFMVLMIGQARVSNQIMRNSLLLREENGTLVADLSLARDSLEEKVRERTAELAAANATLKAEMEARKEAEVQLRQAQKMEAVGRLTGGVAHDFNNILGVVLGNLDLVAESAGDEPRQLTLLGRAIEAAERGASLTHRLLAFSRRQTLIPAVTDVNELVAGLANLIERTLGASIAIAIRRASRLWPCAVDPSQLENAILNLAINAYDAMPNGGALTIETGNVAFEESADLPADAAPGDYVMIAVSDTGTGMSKQVLEHALEPFFTTKPTGKGTGLGLSMVYGFVKQSGGHLQIDSELGRGTTVRLFLPRMAAVGNAIEPVAPRQMAV